MEKVDIIGIQLDLGASKRGVNMGPSAIRYAGLLEKLTQQDITWRDKGDIIPLAEGATRSTMNNYEQIVEANTRLFQEVQKSLAEGYMPIVMGGDHSVAAGSIPAVQQHYGEIGLIWMDAHGDFNDDISSETGNMHGMPFSAVCGHGPGAMVPYVSKFINPRKAVQIGARDVDRLERQRLKDAGVTVFSIADVDKMGLARTMEKAIAIASDGTKGIHVSFDIDVVTPEEAPGVGTPVHSGLTVRESFLAAELLYESGKLLSIDMVEVNPILDQHNVTGNLACELILSMLGKTVF